MESHVERSGRNNRAKEQFEEPRDTWHVLQIVKRNPPEQGSMLCHAERSASLAGPVNWLTVAHCTS